ncbi:MAG: calcium/sodium antiporter [Candidatus Eisenbacteria bacterium]|uniref:Calcium/sodium antiporter n=1 Tax=Eiseniibacteriota bacterium TaxID=2212470 RepID=A0A948W6J0_UNCEI|nr:calcium/sodium antiporter [Candidatus Eisenbacteria bacterium]MBU2690701.1 calcium/sodium antiporter [Candidatus Eisenbacteria bacterium]
MEEALNHFIGQLHWSLLGLWIAVALSLLGKGADWLVVEAVTLSERSGIPKIVIGATIVSIGTTAPEVAVSVLAAIQGNPGLALGNAVGSIICDTGLILGLAAIIAPLTLDRRIVNRQGWIQLGAGLLLVLACIPIFSSKLNPRGIFVAGGNLPQFMGFVFLALLAAYMWLSVRWSRQAGAVNLEAFEEAGAQKSNLLIVLKLIGAIILVVGSARLLIPGVTEAALRLHVPDSVIAATLVAFGTSLPELVTAVTAARKGHGELAIGNIVGADILNVLFVAGAAAAVTGGGLQAGPHFFRLLFPAMLGVLIVFRVGVMASGDQMKRGFGIVLLAVYALVTILSYVFPEFQIPAH